MIGDKIKTLRKQKGYNQEEVANKLHVTRQTISKWEKNYSVPDATLLVRLAEIFDVPTIYFLVDKELGTENTENTDMYAQQLANIAEQIAIKNRRTKKFSR